MPDTNDLKYSWNLNDIFKNTTEFENTKKETLNLLEKYKNFREFYVILLIIYISVIAWMKRRYRILKSYIHMEC